VAKWPINLLSFGGWKMTVRTSKNVLIALVLLWLCGAGSRLTLLAVPPLLPLIRSDLHLSATAVGLLISLPVALFSLAALPGSLLVARLGTLPTLVGGLLVVALGAALRGVSPGTATLFSATVVMGFGVAIMQTSAPAIVRQWLPAHIGFGTATYSNGLMIGQLLPTLITLPLLLPWLNGNWRLALAMWSLPVALTAAVVGVLAPRPAGTPGEATAESCLASVRTKWWPDWNNSLVWRLGIMFGSVNAPYFVANAFLPVYLADAARPDLVGSAVTALNFGQLPASFLLLIFAGRLERRAWPYIAAASIELVSVLGLVFAVGRWTPVWAALFSFATGSGLILGLSLPPLLSAPGDVARTAAAMFTLSYGGAVVVALISGAAWDLLGNPRSAFVPIGLCAIVLAASAVALRRRRELL
jgi:CP family cyanate transporter-like MFS transporter